MLLFLGKVFRRFFLNRLTVGNLSSVLILAMHVFLYSIHLYRVSKNCIFCLCVYILFLSPAVFGHFVYIYPCIFQFHTHYLCYM
jgi:hypothetical protein